jgi:hypothetical protein
VDRWLAKQGHDKGFVMPLATMWALAKAWYSDPRSESWRPRTKEQSQAVLTGVGLTGTFWQM